MAIQIGAWTKQSNPKSRTPTKGVTSNKTESTESKGQVVLPYIKDTDHDSIFQISFFSTLGHIFAYLETLPMD